MTGQDAVGVAEAFHQTLAIDGVIMSKLDGDARGGAALSVKEVIGRPIAFASTGEKLDAFEQFHPDRMAGRILGMGDMLTPDRAGRAGLREGPGRGGRREAVRGRVHPRRLPRADAAAEEDGPARRDPRDAARHAEGAEGREIDDDQLKPVEAIIRSMTPLERRKPGADQRQPADPHRQRQRHDGRRRQPPRQAVRRDAEDDEADGRHGDAARQEGQEGQEGRRGGMPQMPPGMAGMPGSRRASPAATDQPVPR